MDLAAAIQSSVEAAALASESAQVDVSHEAWIGRKKVGGLSEDDFAAPVSQKALVQMNPGISMTQAGQEISVLAIVTFLGPIAPTGAPGRKEPIDVRDLIVLPDGSTGKIVAVKGGLVDPTTGLPYMSQVVIGRKG